MYQKKEMNSANGTALNVRNTVKFRSFCLTNITIFQQEKSGIEFAYNTQAAVQTKADFLKETTVHSFPSQVRNFVEWMDDKNLLSCDNSSQQVALQVEAESLVQRVVEAAKEQSKAREIIRWLAEQDLLSMDSLRLVDPKTECPSHWPLGWKNTLQIVINKLRQEAP